MRNTNSQRVDIMIRVSASQQPPKSHVSHAEIGGRFIRSNSPPIAVSSGGLCEQTVWESNYHPVPVPKFYRTRRSNKIRTAARAEITTASVAPC